MGYVPPRPPLRLNVDRYGMALDYATYMWLLYGKHVDDRSPQRMAAGRRDRPPWVQPPSTIPAERK